ncbi:hypothetical protein BKA57DRAFT_496396 [Linnemannia elongata]|nr:hypothetical protein BKA57DRAFT_496396 [Linnemannia elongata]
MVHSLMNNPHPSPSPSTMQSTPPYTTIANKDYLSKLPPEILHKILILLPVPIHYTHKIVHPLLTLLPLLCVSKHLAHATLPLIYDSPYNRPYFPKRRSPPPLLDEGFVNPTRQLLKWNSNAKECKVLDLVYQLSNDIDGEAISVLDYTAHVRYIHPIGFSTVFPENQISPRIVEYLKRLDEEEEERIMGIELDQLPPGYLETFQNKWDLLLRCFHVELYRQVIWHVAEPILEHLRGLSIPLSDIDRYREVVDRFESLEQSFPENIQVEMLVSIPPTPKLKSLSRSEWLLVKAHPDTVDFCWIESIDLSWFEKPVCEGLSNDWVLPQCRRLKFLSTPPLGSDTFKWAVQEKRDLESVVLFNYLDRGYVSAGGATGEVNDIAIAFSQTLSSLQIEGNGKSSTDTTPLKHFHLGRGWIDMLALTNLQLDVRESNHRVVLDRELLAHCPNITSISISDRTRDYDLPEIVPCLPAYLPRLRVLDLCGWSALTFDPETLSSTPGLGSLTIGSMSWNRCSVFIPPVTELYRSFCLLGETEEEESEETGEWLMRPRWTWDWYLPMLYGLCLTGESAYLFQFKMLTGCPQLWSLTLHIQTNDYNGHPRVITEDDLFIAGAGKTRERIVAENVTEVALRGIWVVESETVLSQFLVDMFPSVTELETRGGGNGGGLFSSLGLESMMSIIRNNPNHKWQEVQTDLKEPNRQEALDYGLCHPEWEAGTLDFETVKMMEVKILFRYGNEDIDGNFLRVLKVLDFERDVSWVFDNGTLATYGY